MNAWKTLAIALLLTTTAFPQSLQFGGFLENDLSFTFADTGFFADAGKLRVELSAGNDAYSLKAHAILSASLQPIDPYGGIRPGSRMDSLLTGLTGSLMMDLTMNMDSATQALLEPMMADGTDGGNALSYLPYSSLYPNDSFVLDRALIKLFFKHADVYVGRQQIAWGTGYAFNPTDIWNMKDPLDPKAAKAGVNAIRLEIPLGDLSNVNLVGIPGPDIKHSSGGIRLKTHFKGFDVSLSASRQENADRELYGSLLNVEGGLPERIIGGWDAAGQIGDIGVWLEGALVNPKYSHQGYSDFDSAYVQLTVGGDYEFGNGFHILGEYYHNGFGESDPKNYNPTGLLYIMAGDMTGFAKNYAMLSLRKTFLDKIDVSLVTMGNLDDASAMILPMMDYYWSDEISISTGLSIAAGNRKESELGSSYHAANIKLIAYF